MTDNEIIVTFAMGVLIVAIGMLLGFVSWRSEPAQASAPAPAPEPISPLKAIHEARVMQAMEAELIPAPKPQIPHRRKAPRKSVARKRK